MWNLSAELTTPATRPVRLKSSRQRAKPRSEPCMTDFKPSPPQRAMRRVSSVRHSSVSVCARRIEASGERQLGTMICRIVASRRAKLASTAVASLAPPLRASLFFEGSLSFEGSSIRCEACARWRTCSAFAAIAATVVARRAPDRRSRVRTSRFMRVAHVQAAHVQRRRRRHEPPSRAELALGENCGHNYRIDTSSLSI